MTLLFECIKLIFFLLTMFLALLHLKGNEFLPEGLVKQLMTRALPGYLIFCGILIGYLVALSIISPRDPNASTAYKWAFIGWIFVGAGGALVYIMSL